MKKPGIAASRQLSLEAALDGRIVHTPKCKYLLPDMIAQCDAKAAPPAELALWEVARSAGREAL